MTTPHVQLRRIEFADTDMAGIVHFANFFRFMEAAEHDLFRSLGFTLHRGVGGGGESMSGWARVDARCEYHAPLRYEDLVAVEVRVREKGRSSVSYDLEFRLEERAGEPQPDRPLVASGRLTTVHVIRAPGEERMKAAPIPPEVDAALEARSAPPEVDPPSARG